jgi:hypothetical protein
MHGKIDLYENFAPLETIDKDDSTSYSNAHLVHEINNAEFFISLEKAATANPEWQLLMWEITSPRSAEIPDKDLKAELHDRKRHNPDGTPRIYTTDRHFNPDGIALLREPNGEVTLNIVETDNNSNNAKDMHAKFEAFIAYDRQDKFPKLIEFYAKKYALDIPNPDDIPTRYLFIASNHQGDHKRRNQIFLYSLDYRRTKQFLFASLTDCTADTILTDTIWMRGREYLDFAKAHLERIIHPETASAVHIKKHHEILNTPSLMPLVSLAAD